MYKIVTIVVPPWCRNKRQQTWRWLRASIFPLCRWEVQNGPHAAEAKMGQVRILWRRPRHPQSQQCRVALVRHCSDPESQIPLLLIETRVVHQVCLEGAGWPPHLKVSWLLRHISYPPGGGWRCLGGPLFCLPQKDILFHKIKKLLFPNIHTSQRPF